MHRPSVEDLEAARAVRDATRKQAEQPAASAPPEPPPAADDPAEWYVGIEGDPVGPIPRSYIRLQIEAGKIDAESLVWKEELTDWKALKLFPVLQTLLVAPSAPVPLGAGVLGVRPPAAQVSDPVALTRVKDQSAAKATEPMAAAKPAPDSDPLTGFGPLDQVKEQPQQPIDDEATVSMPLDPAPAKPAPAKPAPAKPAPAEPAPAESAPAESAPAESAPAESAPAEPAPADSKPAGDPKRAAAAPPKSGEAAAKSTDEDHAPIEPPPDSELLAELAGIPKRARRRDRRRKRRGMHPMAYAFVAMAAGFGGVAAFVLLSPTSPSPDGGSAAGSPGTGPLAHGSNSSPTLAPVTGTAVTLAPVTVTPPVGPSGRPLSTASGSTSAQPVESVAAIDTSKPPGPDKPCDPTDPFCQGAPGPSTHGSSSGGAAAGPGLTQQQAQAVVSKYQRSVARRCLSFVTDGSAKVTVTIRVAPSGAVQNVSASGGGKHPGVRGCVTSRVRGWRFPTASGSSTINVPFMLVAQ